MTGVASVIIDPRSYWVSIDKCTVLPRWELVGYTYQDENESGGNHVIDITVKDKDGAPVSGVWAWMVWPQGDPGEPNSDRRQILGGNTNFPIYPNGFFPDPNMPAPQGPYDVYVEARDKSDIVRGMGLPANRHVNYLLTFRRVVDDSQPPPDEPPPGEYVKLSELRGLVLAILRDVFK
jgi:hypothetical protein